MEFMLKFGGAKKYEFGAEQMLASNGNSAKRNFGITTLPALCK
jgi:hypothetical protein